MPKKADDIVIEKILRFKVAGSGRIVQVATDSDTMDILVELLKGASVNGNGILPGAILNGEVITVQATGAPVKFPRVKAK